MLQQVATFTVIRKRDGRLVKFDKSKITQAIYKAFNAAGTGDLSLAEALTENVLEKIPEDSVPMVEEIQDAVEKALITEGYAETAKAYILYRAKRSSIREGKSELMDTVEEILKETSRENIYFINSPSAKMLKIAAAASQEFYLSRLIPHQYSEAHKRGEIHIHDLAYYSKTVNSFQIPFKKLLKNGFQAGYGYIRPPKKISTATALAAIILQGCQNDMFGGQSFSHFDRDFGDYIHSMKDDDEAIFQAMEGFVYNLNSMYSRVGAQVPLSTINIGTDTSEIGRKITAKLLEALDRGLGRSETPLFPQIIFKVKKGINLDESDLNHDLFKLAVKVASKRMNPTFSFIDATFNKNPEEEAAYWGSGARISENINGKNASTGRGNIALVTINLPRAVLKVSHKRKSFPISSFYTELDRLVKLACQTLANRFEFLSHLKVKELPFLMGERLYMGSEMLTPDDEVAEAIKNGSLAIGFVGLAEALKLLCKKHHGEDKEAANMGFEIVTHLRKKIDGEKEKSRMNFVLAAPPAENLTGRFLHIDRAEFDVIHGVTDKLYYTCGFQLPSDFKCSFKEKIQIEAPFHRFCNGGHFTFIEMEKPFDENAVIKVIKELASSDAGYGGISFELKECMQCGSQKISDGKCDSCESRSIRTLRRSSAYVIPIERANEAKQEELAHRVPNSI